jgi:hypothetical protein
VDFDATSLELSSYGTKIHMWNICDDSRIKVTDVTINGRDTRTECVNNAWHGPTGRWWTGAACDYYGKFGFATLGAKNALGGAAYAENQFENPGVFRLMFGGDGQLKNFEEAEYISYEVCSTNLRPIDQLDGGSPYDQVNAQGYMMPSDRVYTLSDMTFEASSGEFDRNIEGSATGWLSGVAFSGSTLAFGRGLPGFYNEPGKINGMWTGGHMTEAGWLKFQYGELHPAFAVPPLRMKWQGYLSNILDESSASLFANARHAASKKVNLLSIFRASTSSGGEGRKATNIAQTLSSFGVGVRSLDIFELSQLV